MKIVNIEEEGLHIFWTTWGNFSEIFMKDVAPDNIKSYEKAGFLPLFSLCLLSLSRKHIFEETTSGRGKGQIKYWLIGTCNWNFLAFEDEYKRFKLT